MYRYIKVPTRNHSSRIVVTEDDTVTTARLVGRDDDFSIKVEVDSSSGNPEFVRIRDGADSVCLSASQSRTLFRLLSKLGTR